MKKSLLFALAIILAGVFTACNYTSQNQNNAADTSITEPEVIVDSVQDEADDEIREFGLITNIEDSGYPFFWLSIEFPERNMTADFNLNIEAIESTMDELMEMNGKYVTLYYVSELEVSLADMQFEGKSIFGEYAPESIDPEWEMITGVLEGADEVTSGDLPGTISIVSKDGERIDFEWFIDSEMIAVNGKVVTAFYTSRFTETITYLKLSEE